MAKRESEKRGKKERGTQPPSPLSSILDKNKVNGEWGCRRGGCCSAGVVGGDGQGELLWTGETKGARGNDASQAGSYQSERGKAKSAAIDAAGHTRKQRKYSTCFGFPLYI